MEMASTQSERVARQQHGIIGLKPDQDFSLICEIYFENYHRLEFFTSPSHIYFSDSSGADEGWERELREVDKRWLVGPRRTQVRAKAAATHFHLYSQLRWIFACTLQIYFSLVIVHFKFIYNYYTPGKWHFHTHLSNFNVWIKVKQSGYIQWVKKLNIIIFCLF